MEIPTMTAMYGVKKAVRMVARTVRKEMDRGRDRSPKTLYNGDTSKKIRDTY